MSDDEEEGLTREDMERAIEQLKQHGVTPPGFDTSPLAIPDDAEIEISWPDEAGTENAFYTAHGTGGGGGGGGKTDAFANGGYVPGNVDADQVVAEVEAREEYPDVDEGDLLIDKELMESTESFGPSTMLVALSEPYGTADNETFTKQDGDEQVIARHAANKRYDPKSPVVDTTFLANLNAPDLLSGEVRVYTYPLDRLYTPDIDVLCTSVRAEVESVEGLGACENCGDGITENVEQYIEGSDGKRYCSAMCYHEALNG